MTNKPSFDSLLKRVGNTAFYKEAQQASDDTQFEQDFNKIAFSFIQDRAPGLMKYLLGFETVERSEDSSRAVGIFGFKVGKDYYYVPAFFLNNQVKGVDMILNKRTNSFVPLTEEWVDNITNRQAVELGSGASEDVQQDFEDPDFDFLQHPQHGPLGFHNEKISEAPWSFADAWEEMKARTKEAAQKDPEFNKAWSGFVGAITKSNKIEKSASADLFKDYANKVGGPKAVISVMQSLENIKFAEAAMTFYDAPVAFYQDKFASDCYLVKKQAEEQPKFDIKVTDTPRGTEDAKDIVENGFTITDKRKDSDKSIAYTTEYMKYLATPDRPGVYEVLMPNGEFKTGYVLVQDPVTEYSSSGDVCCEPIRDEYSRMRNRNVRVYFPDDKRSAQGYDMRDVYIKSEADNADHETAYSKAGDIGDIEKGETILLVGPEDTYIGPIDVGEFSGKTGERPSFKCGISCGDCWSIGTVEIADFSGRPKKTQNTLVVPSDWKCFKAYKKRDKRENESWHDYDTKVKPEWVDLGSEATMFDVMLKNAHHTLRVSHNNGEFRFNFDKHSATEPMAFKQACITLVTKLGLGYPETKKILKSAESRGSDEYIVKFAQTSPFVGVDMPQPQMPGPTTDQYTGMPTYEMPYVDETQGQLTGVPGGNPYENVYGENVGGEMEQNQELPIDQEAQQLAQQAAELGQKNVFDQATIGGLSRVYDTGSVIDTYIPQFMESLDRLGRVLFLYYWKHDDFISRYGTDDVVEMEDVLRSTFKTLGKLTLDLKRKTIGTDSADSVSI